MNNILPHPVYEIFISLTTFNWFFCELQLKATHLLT